MLFIHKKTGEILEMLIKSVGEAFILPVGHAFPVGEIVLLGNYQSESESFENFNEEFEFLGFLWFLQKKQAQ